MKKAQEPGGAQSLHDTFTKTAPGGATSAPGGIDLANLASAFTGQGQQNVQNAGTQILEQVLGGSSNVQSVVSALASHVGIDQTKTNQLLSLATPIVAAVLGKHANEQGGGANGLASVLAGQGDFLKGMLPGGLGNALGMSGLLGGLGQMAGGIGDRGREAAAGAAAAVTSAGGYRPTSRTRRRRGRGLRRKRRQHFPNQDLAASDFARLGVVAMAKLQHWDRSARSQSARTGCDCESERFDRSKKRDARHRCSCR
jgi:hypothetical protein